MYTWGYLKENILSKLNLDEESANQQGFLSRFPYYANEAMTQICSAIKPKDTQYEILVVYSMPDDYYFTKNYNTKDLVIYNDTVYRCLISCIGVPPIDSTYWKAICTSDVVFVVNTLITFPDDFIAFDDDVAQAKFIEYMPFVEVYDDELEYVGYNQVICKRVGTYKIPYKARWFFFTKELQNSVVIPAPADICEAIPSYVVSQCYKIDDEIKAAIYRNEYEMFLARIDDTSFKAQRTFHIGGGW